VIRAAGFVVWVLLGLPLAAAAQPATVPFELRWGMAQPLLPSSEPFARVSYEDEILGTSVIVTRLVIRRIDARRWQQAYLDSLDIRRGEWATKRDLFRREVQRRFRIDDAEITLPLADGVSYDEMAALLRTLKGKAVVWQARTVPAMDIRLEDVVRIDAARSARQYVIVLAPRHTTTSYYIDAEFDGVAVVVMRAAMAIP
jgi:hypothetical protein